VIYPLLRYFGGYAGSFFLTKAGFRPCLDLKLAADICFALMDSTVEG